MRTTILFSSQFQRSNVAVKWHQNVITLRQHQTHFAKLHPARPASPVVVTSGVFRCQHTPRNRL